MERIITVFLYLGILIVLHHLNLYSLMRIMYYVYEYVINELQCRYMRMYAPPPSSPLSYT